MVSFYLLGNKTISQMFGCVVQSNDKTIVIDGGACGDETQLINFLQEKANGHVDAWFFTHPHHDHIGAFCMLQKQEVNIKVDSIYHCFPSFGMLKERELRTTHETALWEILENVFQEKYKDKVHILQRNEKFRFSDFSIEVLRVYNPNILPNFINNSSAVFLVKSPNNKILILGDLGAEGGAELMDMYTSEDLFADYTQMSHHGQCGCSKEFYEYIKPKRCIWPSPQWLWDNDNGGGFNTGPWQTVQTRQWMEELRVQEHYVEKDGIVNISF